MIKGLGLNSNDGNAKWESIIRATDNKGLFVILFYIFHSKNHNFPN